MAVNSLEKDTCRRKSSINGIVPMSHLKNTRFLHVYQFPQTADNIWTDSIWVHCNIRLPIGRLNSDLVAGEAAGLDGVFLREMVVMGVAR